MRGELLLVLLSAHGIGTEQFPLPRKFSAGIRQRRRGTGLVGARLGERGRIGSRINLEQELALANLEAIAEPDADDLPRYPRADLDVLDRLEPTDVVVPVDDIALERIAYRNERRRRSLRRSVAARAQQSGERRPEHRLLHALLVHCALCSK